LIDEYGIWQRGEDIFLYTNIQTAVVSKNLFAKDEKSISFMADQMEAVPTFLSLALQFGWGGILCFNRFNWICFSHDGWMIVYTENKIDAIEDTLMKMKIKFRFV
jgi:hypothetical protein